MDREIDSLAAELGALLATLRGFGHVEAAMRLRALAEMSEAMATEALLNLAAAAEPRAA